jgi:hypothetical protein
MSFKHILPLSILFLLATIAFVTLSAQLVEKDFSPLVLHSSNVLLFLLSLLGLRSQIKAVASGNGHAMIRSVLGSVVLKLFVLGGAVFLYLNLAGPAKNEKSVLAAMFLYLCYTAVETRMAMRIKPDSTHVKS